MTVAELKQYLDRVDPNLEVLVASQPEYPIREDIVAVNTVPGEEGALWLATEPCHMKPYAPLGAWT